LVLRPRALSLAALVVLTGGLVACGTGEREAATTRPVSQPVDRGDCQRVGTFRGEALKLCFEPNANDHGRFVLASGTSARELAVSPPGPTPTATDAGKVGHWIWAAVSPDEKSLLAQWSGECEVPLAFLVDLANGTPTPVTGESDWAGSPMSVALGWTTDGRAVVFLPRGGSCGDGASPPGVYLYSQAGEGDLLFPGKKTAIVGAKRPRSVAALRQAAL
jgi:hypothetical protein